MGIVARAIECHECRPWVILDPTPGIAVSDNVILSASDAEGRLQKWCGVGILGVLGQCVVSGYSF